MAVIGGADAEAESGGGTYRNAELDASGSGAAGTTIAEDFAEQKLAVQQRLHSAGREPRMRHNSVCT